MDLQFNQTLFKCLQCTAREYQAQEQTQEVRIPEGMPDIGTVLACWGQVVLRGKEWRSDNVGISGGVMARVLYLTEESMQPQSLEVWLPFQMKWSIPTTRQDGTMVVMPTLRSADARTLSARKLMVRTNVGVLMEALTPEEYAVYQPEEVPEDVQLLKNQYDLLAAREAGEKAFNLDETLEMNASEPNVESVIRVCLSPQVLEQKVLADKLVFRGLCIVHLLYRSQDGQLYSRDFDAPFSQYGELSGEYGPDASVRLEPVVTNLELEHTPEGQLHLKAAFSGQYVIFDSSRVELVEDAYSPFRSVEPVQSQLMVPSILDRTTHPVSAQADPQVDVMRAVDMAFWPEQPYLGREGELVQADMAGMFQMLYYDPDGQLQSTQSGWEGALQLPADQDSRVTASLRQGGKAQMSAGMLQVDLLADTQVTAGQGLPMISGLELGEYTEPDPQRPSLILTKAGADTLWDIAKTTGSTVERIRSANGLQAEPSPDKVLLIPLS